MSRRRMMMQQLAETGVDYFEGFRNNQLSGSYSLYAEWIDENTVNLRHPTYTYMGASSGRKPFISSIENHSGGGNAGGIMNGEIIPTLENGKTYRFTATIIRINEFSADASASGGFYIGCGHNGTYAGWIDKYPFADIKVGTEFVMEFTITDTKKVSTFYFGSNGAYIYDYDVSIKMEEV